VEVGYPTPPGRSKLVERIESMDDVVTELEDFGKRWARAEIAGDVAALDAIATKDFILVGPLGFILDKGQWLDRYSSGDFVTSALD